MAATFHLQIVSLDGVEFDGMAQQVSCRTIDGEMAVLAHHINYCTAITVGKAVVVLEDGTRRESACVGGMLTMVNNECRLIANTWEWAEEIDVDRARTALAKTEVKLRDASLGESSRRAAQLKKRRAELRIRIAEENGRA